MGYDSLLFGMGKFLLFLVGIKELIAGQVSRIKPLQKDIRFSGALLGQRDYRMPGGILTIRWNCLKGCIDVSPVRIKDLHKISARITVRQFEKVGPGGQDLPRDLDWLVKGYGCGLVRLVSMSSEVGKKTKSNDQAYDNVKLVGFHFVSSP